VAIRRLRLGGREWRQVQAWLREHLPGFRPAARLEQPSTPASPTVQAFRQAQQRVRNQSVPPPPATSGAAPVESSKPTPSISAPPSASSWSADDKDTLARLRAAKKRARR
jgi:hypothetical protein